MLIPAYNEEKSIRDTLETVVLQTVPVERIIVVDDCSTDRTAEFSSEYPVEVIRTPRNAGSKARALNHALPRCSTDLVMVVDADTFLAPDYLEKMLPTFDNPKITLAAGCILSKNVRTPAERGRSIELLFCSHFHRLIQSKAGAPLVIPGCAAIYRMKDLRGHGGWTSPTVCEDVDYTWIALLGGEKVTYVPDAVVWTIDPRTGPMLGRQVNRWMSSVFQSVRLHWKEAPHQPMLALWVVVCFLDAASSPLIWASPVLLPLIWHVPWLTMLWWWLLAQIVSPPLIYASIKRRINPLSILVNIPFSHYTRLFNSWYTIRALIVELILVPLGISKGMTIFEKGH